MKTHCFTHRSALTALAAPALAIGFCLCQANLQAANDVAAGLNHSITLLDGTPLDDGLWGWGRNDRGQVGDASLPSPVRIADRIDNATWDAVDAGVEHTVALQGGVIYVVGSNASGQLGLPITNPNDTIVDTFTVLSNGGFVNADFTAIAVGQFHTLALKGGTGELWSFGSDTNGQLGNADGASSSTSTPQLVAAPDGGQWVSIAAGGNQSFGITSNGGLYAWGSNIEGQLGTGAILSSNDLRKLVPTQVGTATNWSTVAAGLSHTLAINTLGELYAFGRNREGQLGTGSVLTSVTSPQQVGDETTWSSVFAGHLSSFAIRSDGTVWAWGNNADGQLGIGTNINQRTPLLVPGFAATLHFVDADTGSKHTILLAEDTDNGNAPRVYVAGDNTEGHLSLLSEPSSNTFLEVDFIVPAEDATDPDLAITSFSLSAGQNTPFNFSQSVGIRTQISNLGAAFANANSALLNIYLSEDNDVATAADNVLLTTTPIDLGTTIAVGAQFTRNSTILIPAVLPSGAGDYYFVAEIELPVGAVDSDTANNGAATNTAFAIEDKPALSIVADGVSVDFGGFDPLPGGTADVSFTIVNDGGTFGEDLSFDIRLSTDKVFSGNDIELLSGTINAFASPSSNQTIPVTIPTALQRGEYFFVVRVNGNNAVQEDDTSDNVSSTAIATDFQADLVAESVGFTLSGSDPQPGDTFSTTVTISNAGASISPLGEGVTLSLDFGLLDSDETVIGIASGVVTEDIAFGGTVEVTATLTIPANISTDRYEVRVEVDPADLIDEIDDVDNNVATSGDTIDLLPDFQVTQFTIPAVDIVPGGTIGFKATGINTGTSYDGGLTPAEAVRIDVALSLDRTYNPGSDVILGNTITNGVGVALGNGETFSDSVSFTVPAEVAAGVYYLIAKIDPEGAIQEIIESNNEFVSIPTFSLLADVQVASGSLAYTPATYQRGDPISLDFDVSNTSEFSVAENTPITTQVRLSKDRIWGNIDDIVLDADVAGLQAPASFLNGATVAATASGNVPDFTPPGNYFIAIRVDNDDTILENNDTNNTFFSSTADVVIDAFDLGDSLEETLPAASGTPPAFGEQRDYGIVLNGAASWYAQNDLTNGSTTAAQAGPIGDSQESIMTLSFDEAKRFDFSFDWRVSSEASFDFLILRINGEEIASISGDSGLWDSFGPLTLDAGSYTIDFIYRKDGSDSKADDTAYVDNILIEAPAATGPGTPDFIIVDGQSAPGTLVVQRDSIDFNVSGSNIVADMAATTNPLIVSAVLSQDRDFGNGDDILLGDVNIIDLIDENDQFIYRRIVELPETTRSGLTIPASASYYLGFRIDPPFEDNSGTFQENGYFDEGAGEDNNIYWTANRDYVVETRPDISLENFDYVAGRYSFGDQIELSFDLVNRGLQGIPAFVEGGPVIDFNIELSGDVLATFQFNEGLAVGESRYIQLSIDVPETAEISNGCSVLNVFANTSVSVEESKQLNNSTLNTLLDSAVVGVDIGEALDLPEVRWQRNGDYCAFWTGELGENALDQIDVLETPTNLEPGNLATVRTTYFAEETTIFQFAASGTVFFRAYQDGAIYHEQLISTEGEIYAGVSLTLEAGSFYDLEFAAGTITAELGFLDASGNFIQVGQSVDFLASGRVDTASLFLPDIEVETLDIDISGGIQQLDRGEDIDLTGGSFLIRNKGDADIPPNTPLVFSFVLTQDREIGNEDDFLIRSNVLGFLRDNHSIRLDQALVSGEPGPSIEVINDFRLLIPEYAAPGLYKLGVITNADRSIAELGGELDTFVTDNNVVQVVGPLNGGTAISINEALDNSDLDFTSTTSVPLFGFASTDPLETQNDDDAVQNAFINAGTEASLSTTISGPAELSFLWRSETLPNLNSFNLYQDGQLQARITGTTTNDAGQPDWHRVRLPLGQGSNLIEWRYIKGNDNPGTDSVYLDNVSVDFFDLIGDTIAYGAGQVLDRGDTLTLTTVSIANAGATDFPASLDEYDVSFEILLTDDEIVGDADDILLRRETLTTDILGGGGLFTLSNLNVTIPAFANPGNYFVALNIDDGSTLNETNEANNRFINTGTTIEIDTGSIISFLNGIDQDAVPPTLTQTGTASWFGSTNLPPEFAGAVDGDVGQTPVLENVGQMAGFEIEVQGPATVTFDWLILSSSDTLTFSQFDADETQLDFINNTSDAVESISYFVPASNSPVILRWTYTRGSTFEQDPTGAAYVDNIVITEETVPDLAITLFDVTAGEYVLDIDPRTEGGEDQDKIPVTLEVVNQGAGLPPLGLLGSNDIEIRLSTNNFWGDEDDISLGNFARTEAVDSSDGVLFSGSIPTNNSIPEGFYYLAARVDIYDDVTEVSEDNNTVFTDTASIQITRLPDLNLDFTVDDIDKIYYPESELRSILDIRNIGLDDVPDGVDNVILIELYQITKNNFAQAFEEESFDAYDDALLAFGEVIDTVTLTIDEFIQGRTNQPPVGSEINYELAFTLPTAAELGFLTGTEEENRDFYYFFNMTVDSQGNIRESSERNRAIPIRNQVFNSAFEIYPTPSTITNNDYHRNYFYDLDQLNTELNNIAIEANEVEAQTSETADRADDAIAAAAGPAAFNDALLAEAASEAAAAASTRFSVLIPAAEDDLEFVIELITFYQNDAAFSAGDTQFANILTALNSAQNTLSSLTSLVSSAVSSAEAAANSAAVAANDDAEDLVAQDDADEAQSNADILAVGIGVLETAIANIETEILALIDENFDLDGDTYSNFMEYALALNPFNVEGFSIAGNLPNGNGGDGAIPSSTLTDFFGEINVNGKDFFRLSFNAQAAATDLEYTVQVRDVPSVGLPPAWMDHLVLMPPFTQESLSDVGGLLETEADKLPAASLQGATVRFTVKDDVPMDEIPDGTRIFRLLIDSP